ncbi:release factor, partial [Cantharellus anzutake]|uniref:release factor n=1 Tax=Cantharellus anzutake TaxID=1750568 RepID=UPI00190778B1
LKQLEPLQRTWDEWTKSMESFRYVVSALPDETDPDMRTLLTEERDSLLASLSETLSQTFPRLLIPPSSTTQMSAIMEFKAGAGGDEATLFLAELVRMYTRVATASGFSVELVSSSDTDGSRGSGGGLKDAILEVKGEGAYDFLRWESGVHRVQRVPATESQGRVHTSTVALVVLPSSDESSSTDTMDDVVDPKDVRVEVMRARGAGGQHVNRTESAVRLTHEPTGITVSMQDSRSQHQNRTKAWQILRARLLDIKIQETLQQQRDTRRDLVKSSDRSQKIRTYNFPNHFFQDRLTDHRIGHSLNNLPEVMEGERLTELIAELKRNQEMAMIEDLLENS